MCPTPSLVMLMSGAFLILVEPVPVEKSTTPLTFTVAPSSVSLLVEVTSPPVAFSVAPTTLRLATSTAPVVSCPPVTDTFVNVGVEIVVLPPVTFRFWIVPRPASVVVPAVSTVCAFSVPPTWRSRKLPARTSTVEPTVNPPVPVISSLLGVVSPMMTLKAFRAALLTVAVCVA